MKKSIVMIALITNVSLAQQVKLAWDSVASAAGYRLYAHTNVIDNLSLATVKIDAKTNLTATVSNIVSSTWHFVATAYTTNNIESPPSNELVAYIPPKPQNMRTVVVQWNGVVSSTNWIDAGFFRIKFGGE